MDVFLMFPVKKQLAVFLRNFSRTKNMSINFDFLISFNFIRKGNAFHGLLYYHKAKSEAEVYNEDNYK